MLGETEKQGEVREVGVDSVEVLGEVGEQEKDGSEEGVDIAEVYDGVPLVNGEWRGRWRDCLRGSWCGEQVVR